MVEVGNVKGQENGGTLGNCQMRGGTWQNNGVVISNLQFGGSEIEIDRKVRLEVDIER